MFEVIMMIVMGLSMLGCTVSLFVEITAFAIIGLVYGGFAFVLWFLYWTMKR